ncbi:MAG: hypothetical protein FJZ00_03940 [Candidatus Sericytochromatia bacterium]|uniref:Uncharacterized protein n=1 Tax=Candidatus Tanganyikabacteria bacterium TaxID=2961651 RepID=A0A938BMG9_9BACT|nr:hypothetical protein [Candidatus Tanganyikabacteria bacterium]
MKSWLGFWIAGCIAALALLACGRVDQLPDYATAVVVSPPPAYVPTPGPLPSQTPYAGPTATPSPTPKAPPRPPATGSVFLGTVGSSDLHNDLTDPRGLAFAGGSLFVADANRRGLLGAYGAVVEFDPQTGKRLATYTARTSSTSLPVDVSAVAVSTRSATADVEPEFVFAASPWAVFGHVAGKGWPLNLGAPYAPGGVDVALAGKRAWVAERNVVRAYTVMGWLPDDYAAPEIPVAGIRGIGLDETGKPWIAAAGAIFQGSEKWTATASAPVDPRDVAIDLVRGDVVVLDRERILRYSRDGQFLGAAGEGRLKDSRSLAIGDDGSLYVSDGSTRRVYRFAPP